MNTIDYVKSHYPKAGCVMFDKGAKKHKKDRYWVCFKDCSVIPLLILSDNRLSKANTESKAWKEAKQDILERVLITN